MRFLALAALALALSGCDRSEDGTESNRIEVPTWDLELAHEIGSLEDPDQMLTSISSSDVLLAPDGSLVIGQPSDAQIRIHDEAGDFVRMIGRRGEGPAELGGFNTLGFTPDGNIWIHDADNQRITRFALDGTHVGGESWPAQMEQQGDVGFYWGAGTLRRAADGTALSTAGIAVREGGPGPDVGPYVVRRILPGGELGETVLSMGKLFDDDAPDGDFSVLQTGLLVSIAHDARRIHWIERSTLGNPDPGLIRVGAVDAATGDTLFIRTLPYDPILILNPDEMRREYLDARSERVRALIKGQLWVPETFPPVSHVVPTTEGPLWLAREEGQDPTTWWALDPATGMHIGTLQLPAGERILDQRGDELVTSRRDDLDVDHIRRYRSVTQTTGPRSDTPSVGRFSVSLMKPIPVIGSGSSPKASR